MPLRSLAYRVFAAAVGANLDETELDLGAYPSLGDFFARRLRHGARPLDPRADSVIAPCDGAVAAIGTAVDGTLFQAKGHTYRLEELLADDELAARLTGGDYATIYLSPRDYHRVHAPLDAQIVRYDYLPGALWPVNPRMSARRRGLLARNERVVIHCRSDAAGDFAVIMVGAAGVGNIRLVHGSDSAELRAGGARHRVDLAGVRVRRGDELGAFRLGSTVVMAFSSGRVVLEGAVGESVRFGERIGASVREGVG